MEWKTIGLIYNFCQPLIQVRAQFPRGDSELSLKSHKGRIQKKLITDLVNMVLSPFTPLPSMGLVNKILVKIGEVFTPPISCQDRED